MRVCVFTHECEYICMYVDVFDCVYVCVRVAEKIEIIDPRAHIYLGQRG